jgi:hypothetical protein
MPGLSFGRRLGRRYRPLGLPSTGGGGGSSAAITSLVIQGASPLLDQSSSTDFGDATARVGVNGDGWVAKVTLPYIAATTFDPTKISLVLSDPGFNAGGTTTVNRTIRGGKILRRQYTPGGAQANPMSSNDGVTMQVWFSLIGDNAEFAVVYQGSTISSANAASGFYGSAVSGSISGLTNSSTRPYLKPGVAWLNRQHEVTGSGGQYVELVAMHKHAKNNQQVARVEFIATDAHSNTAATQTCSVPTLSTLCTKGQPPEVYSATIPVTALTQADLCIVNAKVYPWIGDSTAILDLSVDGLNTTGTYTTANPQTTLRFVNDKTGAYGAAHASVRAGVTGGTVQSTETASRATPFPDVASAQVAIAAFNNTRGDHTGYDGGHIWLMDDGSGGAVAHDISTNAFNTNTNNKGLLEIKRSPSNTAAATVTLINNNTFVGWGLSWHVDFSIPAVGSKLLRTGDASGNTISYFNDLTITQDGAGQANYEQNAGIRNVTHVGAAINPMCNGGGPALRIEVNLWLGYICDSAALGSTTVTNRAIIGCALGGIQLGEADPATFPLMSSQDGKIIVNNKFLKNTDASRVLDGIVTTRGLFIGQNVFERAGGSSQQLLSIADLGSDVAIDNIVVTSNTMAGNRFNLLYTDVSTKLKRAWTRYNLLFQRNTKSDVYTADATTTGRNGSCAYINGVDNWDVCTFGDSNGAPAPGLGNWIGEYWANPTMVKVGVANVTFTTDASQNGSNTGGGDYSLTGSSNAAYATVPAGMCPFKYDIAGNARRTDGSGASGAYERP